MRWLLTLPTDRLPQGVAGRARGPLIFLRRGYESDEGLYQHELQHARQWASGGAFSAVVIGVAAWWTASLFGLPQATVMLVVGGIAFAAGHFLLYRFVRAYRLATEVDAFRAQMRFPDGVGRRLSVNRAAERLASGRYRLGISYAQALELLAD